MTDVPPQPRKRKLWPWIAGGCAVLIAGFVAFIVFVVMAASTMMRASEPYREAMKRAENDPRVIETLGSPIEAGMFTSGSINTQNDAGKADLTIPISGPKGKAKLYVTGTKERGTWSYSTMIVTPESGPEIDLLTEGTRH